MESGSWLKPPADAMLFGHLLFVLFVVPGSPRISYCMNRVDLL